MKEMDSFPRKDFFCFNIFLSEFNHRFFTNMNNSTERKPFVSYLSKNEIRFAEKFASKHDLELITPRNLRISETHKQVIWASAKNLALQDLAIKNSKPFVIDYMDFKKIMAIIFLKSM